MDNQVTYTKDIRIFDSEENKLIVGLPYGNELIVIAG